MFTDFYKMTKLKCSNCGEKHDSMHMFIECPDCYQLGCKEELNKLKNKIKTVLRNAGKSNIISKSEIEEILI